MGVHQRLTDRALIFAAWREARPVRCELGVSRDAFPFRWQIAPMRPLRLDRPLDPMPRSEPVTVHTVEFTARQYSYGRTDTRWLSVFGSIDGGQRYRVYRLRWRA